MDIDPAAAGLIFGFKKLVLIAGASGVVLSVVARRQFNWPEALSAVVAGGSSVLFVAPLAVRWAGLAGVEEAERFAAWLAGLCGMYVVDFVFAIAKDPISAWDRFRGRQP
jgi:hypothetical protein